MARFPPNLQKAIKTWKVQCMEMLGNPSGEVCEDIICNVHEDGKKAMNFPAVNISLKYRGSDKEEETVPDCFNSFNYWREAPEEVDLEMKEDIQNKNKYNYNLITNISVSHSVTVSRIYTRKQLLYLGNLPVCSLFPSNLRMDHNLAPVFPDFFKEQEISTPQRKTSLFDDAILSVCDEDLERKFTALISLVEITEKEIKQMDDLCDFLKEVLIKEFPKIKMKRFGSSASGLGLSHCDMDVHISLNGFNGNEEIAKKSEKKLQMRKIARLLWNHNSERFRSAQPIVHANTPIVRLKDRITGIWCDLNSGNRMGIFNTNYIKFCSEFDWRVRSLMMIVKCFCNRHNLTGSGRGDHLTSYSLVLMVIFFLQSEGILHPLCALQNVPGLDSIIIDGFNVAFCADRSQLPTLESNDSSLVDLLRNFFEYFTLFDFESKVICPLLGSPVLRDNLGAGVDLPDCLLNYNRGQGKLSLGKTIVIQDPFELTRNVSGNLSVRKLEQIVTMFRAAALLLGVLVRHKIGVQMDTVFRLLFKPGFEMTEEFSKFIKE